MDGASVYGPDDTETGGGTTPPAGSPSMEDWLSLYGDGEAGGVPDSLANGPGGDAANGQVAENVSPPASLPQVSAGAGAIGVAMPSFRAPVAFADLASFSSALQQGSTLASTTVSFSFLGTGSSGWWSQFSDVSGPYSWSAAEKANIRNALAQMSAVANLDFVESADNTLAATLTFEQFYYSGNLVGIAGFPDMASDGLPGFEGAVGLNTRYLGTELAITQGSFGFGVALHEIGHTLGLKHPHDDGGTGQPLFAELGLTSYDRQAYTVMSYNDASSQGYAGQLGILDVYMLQQLYGARAANTGDTVYNPTTYQQVIWDTGGTDTIDMSAGSGLLSNEGVVIDLREGALSYGAFEDANAALFGVAFGAVIENATGTGNADTLIGNASANTLDGGTNLGAWSDRLVGGAGDDTYIVDAGTNGQVDVVEENAGEGFDTVRTGVATYAAAANIESIVYTGGTNADLSIGAGDLAGGSGHDRLTVTGSSTLASHLDGGAGRDTALIRQARSAFSLSAISGGTRYAAGDGTQIDVVRIEGVAFQDNSLYASLGLGALSVTLTDTDGDGHGDTQYADIDGDGYDDRLYQDNLNGFWMSLSDHGIFDTSVRILDFGGAYAGDSFYLLDAGGDSSLDVVFVDGNGDTWLSINGEDWSMASAGGSAAAFGTGAVSAGVAELEDGPGENTIVHSAAGDVAYSDVDINDSHAVSVTSQGAGYLGTFTAAIADSAEGDGAGAVSWTFAVDDSALDYLDAGETLSQLYDLVLSDVNGLAVTRTVAVTITGAADEAAYAPVVTGGTTGGTVTENIDGSGPAQHSVAGTLAFSDLNLTNTHSVSVSAPGAGYLGTLTASITDPATGDGAGAVTWSFTVSDAALALVAGGHAQSQVYGVTIMDSDGLSVTQAVEITLESQNDAPTFDAIDVSMPAGLYFKAIENETDRKLYRLAPDGTVSEYADIPDYHTGSHGEMAAHASGIYFIARNAAGNIPLYRADASGVVTVVSTADFGEWNPAEYTSFNGSLYIRAKGTGGAEFYEIDGSGNLSLHDIRPGSAGSAPASPVVFQKALYFGANIGSGSTSTRLFRINADGTTENVSALSSGQSVWAIDQLAQFGSDLYFRGTSASTELDLFRYSNDGTISLAIDFGGSVNRIYGEFDGGLYLSASLTPGGLWELVRVEGDGSYSVVGNGLGRQINNGYDPIWSVYNGEAYFATADSVYKIDRDGAVAFVSGDRLLHDFEEHDGSLFYSSDGTLYRIGVDGVPTAIALGAAGVAVDNGAEITSVELLSAVAGSPFTVRIPTVNDPDSLGLPLSVVLSAPHGMLSVSLTQGLTFSDADGSDGTVAFSGTQSAINAALAGGVVYTPDTDFAGLETITVSVTDVGNASASTTVEVAVKSADGSMIPNAKPTIEIGGASGALYFVSNSTDGSNQSRFSRLLPDGTVEHVADVASQWVQDFNVGIPGNFIDFGGDIYFGYGDATTGTELYRLNGDDSLELVYDALPGSNSGGMFGAVVMGGSLFYTATVQGAGREIVEIKADGTVAVHDLRPGTEGSGPSDLTVFNGAVYSGGYDPVTSPYDQLFRVNADGTAENVSQTLTGSELWNPQRFLVVGDDMYLTAWNQSTGSELFKLSADGTASLIADIEAGTASSIATPLIEYNGELYLTAETVANGRQLYRLDANGSLHQVGNGIAPTAANVRGAAAVFNNELYIEGGGDIYKIDAAGTVTQVSTLNLTGDFAQFDGALFFQASQKLYRIDADGTVSEASAGLRLYNNTSMLAFGYSPPSVTTDETTPVTISSISVADPDSGNSAIAITLTAANGELALADPTGVTVDDGDGTDGTIRFHGTVAALNAVLAAGVVYTPETGFTGTEALVIGVDDGAGGFASESLQIAINGAGGDGVAAPTITSADATGAVTELPDGATGENATTLTDSGTISFTDANLTDSHTVSVAAQGGGYRGTLTAVIAGAATGDGAGQVEWIYSVADSALDDLNLGQTLTQLYDVTVSDGNGGSVTQTVTVTIAGAADINAAPTISVADSAGAVTELPDGATGENATTLSDSGTIDFSDLDLTDTHSVTVTQQGSGYRGALTAVIADTATGDGSGQVAWTYSVADSALDDLDFGQTLTQLYDVAVSDGNGGTVTQTVTVTIAGAADAGPVNATPTVTGEVLTGSVTELPDNDPGEDATTHEATGTIDFEDLDLSDAHIVSVARHGQGLFLGRMEAHVADAATGDGSGQIVWTYSVEDSMLGGLGAGQNYVEQYDITVDDGNGGTFTRTVAISVNETADVVPSFRFTAGVLSGDIAELPDGDPNENLSVRYDSGNINFTNTNLADSYTVSFSPRAPGYRGTFEASLLYSPTTGVPGIVVWNIRVPDADLDDLDTGELVVQLYDVTLTSGSGGTAKMAIEVRITGADDTIVNSAPVVTGTDLTGAVAEIVYGEPGEGTATLSDSGTIDFSDLDLTDAHSVTVSQPGAGYRGIMTVAVADPATGDGTGQIRWTYSVQDAALNDLTEGQVLTQNYDVTVSDGRGGAFVRTVSVTITGAAEGPSSGSGGANSAPEIVGEVLPGDVTELPDGDAGEGTATIVETGTFTFTDANIGDVHTIEILPVRSTHRGVLTAEVTNEATDDGVGEVTWTYTVQDADLDDLDAGETLQQQFNVHIFDASGASASTIVTVNAHGAFDDDPGNEIPEVQIFGTGGLYYSGWTEELGWELYRLDPGGAVSLVADLGLNAISSFPGYGEVIGDDLYFQANSTEFGGEAFRLDMTDGSVSLVADLRAVMPADPRYFTEYNGAVYFTSKSDIEGTTFSRQLYRFDPEANILGGPYEHQGSLLEASQQQLIEFNGELFFTAESASAGVGDELFKLTADGEIELVADLRIGAFSSLPTDFAVFDGALYFMASPDPASGRQLFRLDADGSVAVVPGAPESISHESNNAELTLFNGSLFFRADTAADGLELYKLDSDGNVSLIADIAPGTGDSRPSGLTVFNGSLYFGTTDPGQSRIEKIWRLDADETLHLVADVSQYTYGKVPTFFEFDGGLYFEATSSTQERPVFRIGTDGSFTQVSLPVGITKLVASTGAATLPTTDEATPLLITGVSVSDADAGSDAMTVSLSVGNGTLALASSTGLTFTDADGSDGTLAFIGTLAWIDAALKAGIVYTPETGFNGSDTLSVAVDDGRGGIANGTTAIVVADNGLEEAPAPAPVIGTAGDDMFAAGSGAEAFEGGAGRDTVTYAASTSPVHVWMTGSYPNTGDAAGDTFDSIEVFVGTSGNDRFALVGDGVEVFGGAGNDTITGTVGDDILDGGAGADILSGTAGIDTASYADASAGVVASLIDREQNAGDAAGDVYINIENLLGSAHDDTLTGDAGDNAIDGGAGNDVLSGDDGDDVLSGGANDDVLRGGRGADLLDGGAGTDTASYRNAGANIVVHSDDPTAASWTVTSGTFTALGSGTGPVQIRDYVDGYLFTATADGASFSQRVVAKAGTEFTYSVNVAPLGMGEWSESGPYFADWIALVVSDNAGNESRLWYHIGGGGTPSAQAVGNATISATHEYNYTGNWYRIGVTVTLPSDDVTIRVFATDSEGGLTMAAGDKFRVMGVQAEMGSQPNAFVVTDEAPVSGVVANLADSSQNTGEAAGDTYVSVENLDGTDYEDVLTGDGSANTITGNAGDDSLSGGEGDDTLIGGTGDDTYGFRRGDGADVIDNSGESASDDFVNFGTTIAHTQLWFAQSGSDLVVSVIGTTDSITVRDWYDGTGNRLDFLTSSGMRLSADDVQQLVDAMALSSIPDAGETSLPSLQSSALASTLAAAWQNVGVSSGINNDGDDDLSGDDGDNMITGGDGNDTLDGGAGNDWLYGDRAARGASRSAFGNAASAWTGGGADQLFGRAGNDTLTGGEGGDLLDGGDGFDIASYADADSGVVASLLNRYQNTGFAAGDQYIDIEALAGSDFDDTLSGDGGDNSLWGGAGNDLVLGGGGIDLLFGGADNDALFGDLGADQLDGEDGDDWLYGGAGNDVLRGGAGNDYLIGEAGADDLDGGDGIDYVAYYFSATGVTADLSDDANNAGDALGDRYFNIENILGTNFEDVLTGDGGANWLAGRAGNDTISGGGGDDTIFGDEGVDVLRGGDGDDLVIAGSDNDEVYGDAGSDGLFGGDGDDTIYGGDGNDSLYGENGNDWLNGGAGVDAMTGGAGDDTYIVEDVGDWATEYINSGTDTVLSSVSYALGAFIEILTLTGTALEGAGNDTDNTITGNAMGNALFGNSGDDTIDGGGGDDWLYGGWGDDVLLGGVGDDYLVGQQGADTLDGGDGVDYVSYYTSFSGVSADLADQTANAGDALGDRYFNMENLSGSYYGDTLFGDDAVNWLRGLGGGDTISGRGGDDIIFGDDGDDTIFGGDGNDLVMAGVGTDILYGDAGSDALYGGSGNDWLYGGAGSDFLYGETGDDTYVVDEAGDWLIENADEGIDTVESSIAFTLAANFENLTLTGSADIDGNGNAADNVLIGNSGINALHGGAGSDRIDGGGGADALYGGTGDDVFVVDDAGDVIYEAAGEGADSVESSVSYALGANVENLTLVGIGDIDGTGNALDNVLGGNDGANVLLGGAGNDVLFGEGGADTLDGEDGNDWIYGGDGDDRLIGGAGTDYLIGQGGGDVLDGGSGTDTATYFLSAQGVIADLADSNNNEGDAAGDTYIGIENLQGSYHDDVLTGDAGDNVVAGLSGNDTIFGGAGNDVVFGQDGSDSLHGGAGGDLLMAGDGNDLLFGDEDGDALYGDAGDDTLEGGEGADMLVGGAGNDTYVFGRGDANDTIDNAGESSSHDLVLFGSTVVHNQLWFEQTGNDLKVSIIGTDDSVTVDEWFSGTSNRLDFEAGDSFVLTDTRVQALVNAMASFSPPAFGETELDQNASYYSSLSDVIASSWQSS